MKHVGSGDVSKPLIIPNAKRGATEVTEALCSIASLRAFLTFRLSYYDCSLKQITKRLMNKRSFSVGSATFGDGRLTIIAGPCVIESEEHALMMARECAARAHNVGLDFVFKTSFDKANRSSIKSFRGLGMEAGLEILENVKKQVGVPVLTHILHVAQVERTA